MNELNQADKTLHSLAQLIALTGMQWLPILADDSQTNMAWNSKLHRLEGRPFVCKGQQVRLVINTTTFTFYFVDDLEQVLASFLPENRTPVDAAAWWKHQMQTWGISEIRAVNYQLDQDPVDPQTVYKPTGLTEWTTWRTIANTALQQLNGWSGRASEVRIWPHHFDTGIYYSQTDANGQEKAAIWAGYAIADALCNEPYFYLSGYNSMQPIDFASAPALSVGEWRTTSDWNGALLPISASKNAESIAVFFQESYSWLDKQLLNR
ncbi:hypothetical protein EXU85_02695 [Spirosoma sp. KCTC 42546]|uniref:hypothetical protein n=1 Tax=Spirosoma sp. KCTC 42546 TaxID=2520506 RepID=UPI00115887B1|nr:hypothetical protein [Spirosoma sp. KCTC 42546]QDK77561.1 hypothetical protein EXU85_02695 [Spirosoma sp. KCTC 42546]